MHEQYLIKRCATADNHYTNTLSKVLQIDLSQFMKVIEFSGEVAE